MSLSNDVATVALVVSLVALIISGLQLLQQLFGTSEGWSRCGPLVIGDWSRLRRSRWLWTEMRYETKFVTPRIIIVNGSSDLDSTTPVSEIFKKQSWYPYAFLKSSLHAFDKPHSIVKFWDRSLEGHPRTKSGIHASQSYSHFKTKIAVTWPELVQFLGRYYYIQLENTVAAHAHVSDKDASKKTSRIVPERIHGDATGSVSNSRSENLPLLSAVVALKLEEHSWDAMPPAIGHKLIKTPDVTLDVVRPMASISLGHLVILATRLGMRWRRISFVSVPRDARRASFLGEYADDSNQRLQFDGLQATGAFGSISSTMIPGLGTIALFNFTSADLRTSRFRLLVPSKDADKLMCGVIPATPSLSICAYDGGDILAVEDDRSLKTMRDLLRYDVVSGYHRFSKEELYDKLIDSIIKRHRPTALEWWARAAIFDAWCMLCPFIPVESSPIVDIILPLPGQHMRTPLNYPGGRGVLSLLFRNRFQPREDTAMNAEWVQTLLDSFKTLDTHFRSSKRTFQGSPLSQSEIVRRVAMLRQIHEKASDQLFQKRIAVPPLVGVHVLTVMSAARTALSSWNNDSSCVDQGFAIDDCVAKSLLDMNRMHLLAYCYVDEIEAWKKYAFDRDRDLMQSLGDDGELVWWTLVLRAISWALSVRVNVCGGPIAYEPVPSSLYGDPTPIWIM